MAQIVGGCLGIIFLIVVIGAILGFIFMVLWNVVAPVFGLPTLDFVQAVAMTILIGFIGSAFKTFVSK